MKRNVNPGVVRRTLLVLAAIAAVSVAAPRVAEAQILDDIPVTGGLDDGGTFAGTLDVIDFRAIDGVVNAVVSLTGTLTDAAGGGLGSVQDLIVTVPLADLAATCDVLHLELGPLDLAVLGLVVHLDRVVLDIDAEAAPGNLLGNLLCAIAHLLDGPAAANAIAALLDRVLDLLS